MSEPIKWQELTPAQRDMCVHEKVMGYTRTTVTHTCGTRAGDILTYDVTSWQTGGPGVPRYTQSMDEAHKVLLYVAFNSRTGISDLALLVREVFMMRPGEIYAVDPFYTLGVVNGWTPEFLCIACLRACGFEVINEPL